MTEEGLRSVPDPRPVLLAPHVQRSKLHFLILIDSTLILDYFMGKKLITTCSCKGAPDIYFEVASMLTFV